MSVSQQESQPLVTVITATVGNPLLSKCLKSVEDQTHQNIQHLVIVDRDFPNRDRILYDTRIAINAGTAEERTRGQQTFVRNVINLPYSTGEGGYNGHRVYGAGTYLSQGEFVMFLDDDNAIKPTHIEDCINAIRLRNLDWTYSLRNIVDANHDFICEDNCESLGRWPSILSRPPQFDFFVDVNCYFLPKMIAVAVSPIWNRKFRQPGQMEVDRALMHVLMSNFKKFDTTYKYTVDYAVGNTVRSVQADFFKQGNPAMLQQYNGALPWKHLP